MTYRLTVFESNEKRHVYEVDDFPSVLQKMMGQVPWHDQPTAVVVQRLGPWENVTWSVVASGDEVIAPNNTVWVVDVRRREGSGPWSYEITNTLDGTTTTTTPQADALVRRRRGPATNVRQMFTDAGIATKFIQETP